MSDVGCTSPSPVAATSVRAAAATVTTASAGAVVDNQRRAADFLNYVPHLAACACVKTRGTALIIVRTACARLLRSHRHGYAGAFEQT